ncbi:MAG TPA: nucleotidyl transferase AbiEii/AbiGii toxin family protein [Cryomorphaceae bacterium]|nr:nucleotidyltransferase [Owenweeksia sp.]MBF99596.1 nucleotidyltransferase [Owenweeksia sp.]HAD97365.1 nucleotidyl transferase AbiEii/AbiGii toxin family protein [Cryomorphaceae bacterium]HBF19239.1 nucleotidyl transferase AbiEii/AbiGii toxin family protein [Cryomorphaceae bacterium]HCQ17597.1 nucleotidyl transferase AbiEii/AbiGii toxin family protein [Cryomorphaceae bacterium]
MIPKPYIARWKEHVSWTTNEQVEQDLIISRALVELFSDDFLRENLAFRGGTALHKLYLHPAPRYSEDIDLVQIKEDPIKPILQRIGEVITFFEEERVVKQKASNNSILYRFTSEYNPDIRLRLKIEINCREHFNLLGWKAFPFEVKSDWFSGSCEITTYHLNELLGTKLRALYQRKKGRDLFDMYYAGQNATLDYDLILKCYHQYMNFAVGKPPSQKEFLRNMEEKKTSAPFLGDMEALLKPGVIYDQDEAFTWLEEKLTSKM